MPIPGPMELIVLLVVALVIVGPGKLPELGSAIGRGIRDFKKSIRDNEETVAAAPKTE